jgi:3-oxoacyl-[acyl-carrier-protein] synthase-3
MTHGVTIAGTGSYLPEKILTNDDLSKFVETSDEWIVTRTGIKERRIAAEGESTSHLGSRAAEKALEQAGMAAEDLDLIIVATITPDTLTPATACYVQRQLGATKAVAFDISAACSGFLYAMKIAKRMIESGAFENALIIGAEKLSAFVNWKDRTTCVLFGDGAGAAVLRASKKVKGVFLPPTSEPMESKPIFSTFQVAARPAPSPSTMPVKGLATLAMLGKEVFKHAVTRMKNSANLVIERAGLQPADIAVVIPHQANLRIIDAIASRLDVPNDRVFINLHKYGNTSAAAIAIALDEAHREGKMKRGDKIVMVAFGAGLTWAAAAIEW